MVANESITLFPRDHFTFKEENNKTALCVEEKIDIWKPVAHGLNIITRIYHVYILYTYNDYKYTLRSTGFRVFAYNNNARS